MPSASRPGWKRRPLIPCKSRCVERASWSAPRSAPTSAHPVTPHDSRLDVRAAPPCGIPIRVTTPCSVLRSRGGLQSLRRWLRVGRSYLGVVLRDLRRRRTDEPVEPDPVSTGVGSRCMNRRRLILGPLVLCVSLARAASAGDDTLEEIVVTASLRSAPVADLPQSVTVLARDTLQAAGVQHFEDVLSLIPDLNYASG